MMVHRAQPDWKCEFPDWTGLDTQLCQTGPAGLTESGLTFFNILPTKYGLSILIR